MFRIGSNTRHQIQVQVLVVVNDLHPASSENVRGSHDHRIAELAGDLAGLIGAPSGTEAGVRYGQLGQQAPEAGAVLGQVYGLGGGAEDLCPVLLQLTGELQGTLAAELEDDAVRLLATDDLQDVLGGQGFEVEPRGGVVVSRDGLGVGVDHHRVVASLFESVASVDAGVVELDALSDAVRATPEHDHGRVLAALDLVFGLVGRIVVGRPGGELTGAGVDGLVRRVNAQGAAYTPYHLARGAGGGRQRLVGEPGPLELQQLLLARGLGG